MRAELHFLGIVIALFYIDTVYRKEYNKKGIPVFYNQGGLLYFEFPYGKSYERLLERMLTVDYDLSKYMTKIGLSLYLFDLKRLVMYWLYSQVHI